MTAVSTAPAFWDWQGFRFGERIASPAYSRDIPWGVSKLADDRWVIAGESDDSTCCLLDPVGAFGGSLLALEATPFLGFPDSDPKAWRPEHQWGYRNGLRVRWFDLQGTRDGGFAAVGSIADTVLFTGTRKIWRGGQGSDSTDWLDQHAILTAGGGGGVGIGQWFDRAMRLRLLRFGTDVASTVGWQILSGSEGITIAGSFEARVPGHVFEGIDSFSYPAREGMCFAFHPGEVSGTKWWTTLPCATKLHPEIARTAAGLWMTFNDSLPGAVPDSYGLPRYRGVRPGLARLNPATGTVLARMHPLGDMQGMVRSLASDEEGNLLLQGEQSSSFLGPDGLVPPVLDTLLGPLPYVAVTAGWLALLDSTGTLRKFRQLHGLENVGGWKFRRIPGSGWLALSWDEHDVLGWSRLYLFDDTLGLIDSSSRLPNTFDVELGVQGEILLTGTSHPADSAFSWLRGSGSMWAASCRLGSGSAKVGMKSAPMALESRIHRGFLEIIGDPEKSILVRGTDPRGRIWLDRSVEAGEHIELPRGLSVLVAQQGERVLVRRFLVP